MGDAKLPWNVNLFTMAYDKKMQHPGRLCSVLSPASTHSGRWLHQQRSLSAGKSTWSHGYRSRPRVSHMFVDERSAISNKEKFAGYQFHYRLKKDFSKESSPNKLRTTDTMIVPQMMAGDDNQNKNKKKNNNDDSVAKTTTTATTRA